TESTAPRLVKEWIRMATRRLMGAKLCFDNGLQTAEAEAEYLLFHVMALPFEEARRYQNRQVTGEESSTFLQLLEQRILKRTPVHYLTKEAFFAGLRLYVDERVLIPRSRIELLIDDPEGLPELVPASGVKNILDLCTGSGCLAFALALLYPNARVDGSDLSADALAVARINQQRLKLEGRVRLIQSDLFAGLKGRKYDLIVSNPPYVPRSTLDSLPVEFQREPALALDGGVDGLILVETILRQAVDHLTPQGYLICEVGDETEKILRNKYPGLFLEWLEFYFGGSGVFMIDRQGLWQGLGRESRLSSGVSK
ncbi:MAG: 50S ribosomal protein L3 N(5)-glutamine methyltransferase, partial [Magnetococcales bacterium]|nr:50S ribosomal protein L3 N(5)-glutamine methyltransferase [Magnetococcales bacterium]